MSVKKNLQIKDQQVGSESSEMPYFKKKRSLYHGLTQAPNESTVRLDMNLLSLIQTEVIDVQRSRTADGDAALAAHADGNLIDITQVDALIGKSL